jgi:hypothetical protein
VAWVRRAAKGGEGGSVTAGDEPPALTDEQVDTYLEVLVTHGSVYGPSVCSLCGVARCAPWVEADERLTAAHVKVELQ